MKLFGPDTSMLVKLDAFWTWVRAGCGQIIDELGRLVTFAPNSMQRRLYRKLRKIARRGVPIRLFILKARKHGCSTFIQLLFAFLIQWSPYHTARTVAHTDKSTTAIHAIAARCIRLCKRGPEAVGTGNPITFPHESLLETGTAGGQYVFSGATTMYLHLSELPKWPGDVDAVRAQLASVLNSVPDNANTIIIIEATANMLDSSGEFKSRYLAARAGGTPYECFFSPWYEDDAHRVDASDFEESADQDQAAYEEWLRRKFKLDNEKILWYRDKLASHNNDRVYMKQEFPTTEEEAFQSPSGLIYPMLCRDAHHSSIEPENLQIRGYDFYRAIDFGASDAFVCLWVAHKPGPSRFTIDVDACPETWRELTGYSWGKHGRPKDENDHTCDALRYAVMNYDLTGHVYVWRELYEPDSAAHGRSLLNQAHTIQQRSGPFDYVGTVADRSQPGNIVLLAQHGIHAEANPRPENVTERGEKLDGITHLQALMIATIPIVLPDEPEEEVAIVARDLENAPVPTGVDSSEMLVALNRYRESIAGIGQMDPIHGVHI
jgi:hypothetical protein